MVTSKVQNIREVSDVQVSSEKQIKALKTNIAHFKSVIRKVEIISEEAEKSVFRYSTINETLSNENRKRLDEYLKNVDSMTTEEKLEKVVKILFTNFDIVNNGVVANNTLAKEFYEYLKRTRNTLFTLLKSTEYLLELNQKEKEN